MKQMKCILKGFVLFILVIIMTGCGKEKEHGLDKNNPVSITIWHYYNGVQKQQFDNLVRKFNETIGIEKGVIVEAFSQSGVNELETLVMDAVEERVGAKEVPDIFSAYTDTANKVYKKGLVADIGKYLTEEEIGEYIDYYLEEGRLNDNDELLIFPIVKSTEVFIINETDWNKFADATGADDSAFATWEGIVRISEEYYNWTDSLTEDKDDGQAFFGRDAMANYVLIGSMQLGKDLFEVNDGEVSFNIDKGVMRRIWDNYYVPYIKGHYKATGRFRSDDAKTGEIVATVGSSSSAPYFPTDVTLEDGSSYPIEAKVYPVPNFEGTVPWAVQQGAGMVVTKSNYKKEYASILFLKWFTEEERNIDFAVSSGYLPVKKASNDKNKIQEIIDKGESNNTTLIEETIDIGLEMVQNYKLYSSKTFDSGIEAREIVDTSLQNKADNDRKLILNRIASGASREEAIAEFNTDKNFQRWFEGFLQELQQLK